MRINRYIAAATGLSRRAADTAITDKRVSLNGRIAVLGDKVEQGDQVALDNQVLARQPHQTILFHKPAGYVTSRRKQGRSHTIYHILPPELHRLKPVGRLDRESSGLLLLTDDGDFAQRLQHPSNGKWKRYEVRLDRALKSADLKLLKEGVLLDDGISILHFESHKPLVVTLQEGRNRQIRRSFGALGYHIEALHRTHFGPYALDKLPAGEWKHPDQPEEDA